MRLLLFTTLILGCFSSFSQEVDTLFAHQYIERAQMLHDSAQYDSSTYYFDAASVIYEKALPYLKKALEIDLKDYNKALYYYQNLLTLW